MTPRAAVAPVTRLEGGARYADADLVTVEAPLRVELTQTGRADAVPLGLMMRTPGDDEDLVTGLLVGEGLVVEPAELRRLAVEAGDADEADLARVEIDGAVDLDARVGRRVLASTSACGLCGRMELTRLDRRAGPAPDVRAEVLAALPGRLRAGQPVFDQTGGLHAAGLFALDGAPEVLREDVGRHNAVDKVVGAAWRAGRLPATDLLLAVSGRVAFEIVQKAAAAGVTAVIAVGAPSSLAVAAARVAGLVLAGFARDGRANIYAGEHRVV